MDYLSAFVLGVVEGLTEFLPISSTGHLVITSQLLGLPESPFLASFIIVIQLGAIASVVLLYWRTLLFDFATLQRLAVAFIPTALIGFLLYSVLKNYLLESLQLIAWMLLLGGIALILFEKYAAPSIAPKPLTYGRAFLVGCAQAVAMVPGVSRAGATIIGGLALGMSREKIVEFSFLLAIPTMLAATGYDLLKSAAAFTTDDWGYLVTGFIVSFLAAYVAVRWLIRYVQTHTFTVFGWYRIALGTGILALLYMI